MLIDISGELPQIPDELIPLLIFFLRTFDLTIATLRMLYVIQGRRRAAWLLGFLQAASFISSAALVLGNLLNPINILAYAAGFAAGNVVGMTIETRLIPGYSLIRIISPRRGSLIAEALRNFGHGVTEVAGRGRDGAVSLIYCYVLRRDLQATENEIIALDEDAFVTKENVRQVRGGWLA
jgi:uncharacterized protein YebE (UPF0316 family)